MLRVTPHDTAAEAGRRVAGEYLQGCRVQAGEGEEEGEWLCLHSCEDVAVGGVGDRTKRGYMVSWCVMCGMCDGVICGVRVLLSDARRPACLV